MRPFLLSLALLAPLGSSLRAQGPGACDSAAYHRLDFWVGEWEVTVDGQPAGRNRIEPVLNGCAITETWQGAGGGEGRSLFYYLPVPDQWRQVWVTGNAARPGGVKEKREVGRFPDGGIRFQGTIELPGGRSYLDRTTLTPLPDGSVRQLIETSTDDGKTWKAAFDGLYRRASAGP